MGEVDFDLGIFFMIMLFSFVNVVMVVYLILFEVFGV